MATAEIENSTDATRGEPLATRVVQRKAELEQALATLPADRLSARNDLEIALKVAEELLTGDLDHLTDATAATMSHWLERCKHLAETTPSAPVTR